MSGKIALGNDHAGTELKLSLRQFLEENGYHIINFGTDSIKPVDYPDYVHPVVNFINEKESEFGILICGSAQGVSITANNHPDIRAAVCWDDRIALLARKHNNANIICLPARFLTEEEARKILLVFLNTEFEGGRHSRRIEKIGLRAG